MIQRIISGGQTGADQAGWEAAKAAGIVTDGWMPKGFKTEAGPRPDFAELYGAREHASPAYPPRTEANILMADVTLIFDTSACKSVDDLSAGSKLATNTAIRLEKPSVIIRAILADKPEPKRPEAMAGYFRDRGYRVVNVAGNRESKAPGINDWVRRYMIEVFRLLEAR